ncbi:DNA binding/packing protein [Armadillidium vulgare iridescent virus]|uniref:DNA binding/packing protein n=1 Tax=Armadillidium vulgare iridescent virus TaxID=72201 RepID=A0A068QL31_9VIRU|nr:DNA binding/packing protein [Armadillidium vulgare iridescent virus]CCV02573.1 DNA binding/packing protein [Armadillidium vulgare iridescent virus]
MKNKEDLDILNLDDRIKNFFRKERSCYLKYKERLKEIEKQLLFPDYLRPKILLDLRLDKKSLENKLTNVNNYYFYDAETTEIIQQYLILINTPLDVEFETIREEGRNNGNNGRKKPNENGSSLISKRRKIVKEYVNVAKTFLSENLLKSLELLGDFGKEDLFQVSSVLCETCGADDLSSFTKDDDVFICQICHTETVKLVNSSSFNDGGRINVCNKYSYDRKVHFKDCINQYQGKQNTHINPKIYDELEEQLVNNRIIPPRSKTDSSGNPLSQIKRYKKVTRAHVQLFLKALGYTKHYEDCILIHYTLTGKVPDNIEHLEEKLMSDFDQLTEQYDLLFKDIERKNFINTQYVLFQLLQKHKYPCSKDDFAVLKTTERKACHDDICKTLFDSLGWDYRFVR